MIFNSHLSLNVLVFFLIFNMFFVDLTSSVFSAAIMESDLYPGSMGVTLSYSSIALEGRIAQNQMFSKLGAVNQSSVENYENIGITDFSVKLDKSMTQLPISLLLTSAKTRMGIPKNCTAYAWDDGLTVTFFQNCTSGETYVEFFKFTLYFKETDFEGCNDCQTSSCGGRPCADCQANCSNTFLNINSWIEASNGTLKSSDKSLPYSKQIPTQIAPVCQNMGQGPGRYLMMETRNTSSDITYAFTPSTETASNPPENMTLLCLIWVDIQNGWEVKVKEVRDTLHSGQSVAAVVLPFAEYRSEYEGYFLVYCDSVESSDPAAPGQTWQVRLFVYKPDDNDPCQNVSVMFSGMDTCPDNADVDIRKTENGAWEVVVVSVFKSIQNMTIFTVFIDPLSCVTSVYQMYKYNLAPSTQSIMFGGDEVTSFGDFVNLALPSTSTPQSKVTLFINVKNAQTSWVSMLTWVDWKTVVASGSFNRSKASIGIPSTYVTSFPNNNIRLTHQVIQDVQTYVFGEGVWLAWQDAEGGIGSTTIYSCPLGEQFITDLTNSSGPIRGCFLCPPGQFKNSSQIGENCQLCPSNTYSNISGSTNSSQCIQCTGSDYCPSGMNSLAPAQNFGETTYSCTNPWFDATDGVDLEGSFYINQGILIFILSMITAALCVTVLLTPQGSAWMGSYGVWLWDLEETETETKKTLWGIAAFAATVAYILLIIFILYTLIGANTFISVQVDVENAARSNYPTEYDTITTDPLYFSLTLYGVVSVCESQILSLSSSGFYAPDSGADIQPSLLYNGSAPGSAASINGSLAECQFVFGVSRAISDLNPQIQVSYDPGASNSYINRVQIDISTGLEDNGKQLKTCQQDETVTTSDNLNRICDQRGYGFASVLLTASENRALRGAADVTIVKTLGVVENCKPKYNAYPWSFAQTQMNCNWCNSSTMFLFPSVVKSSLLESSFYYERDPSLSFTITMTEDTLARTASISRYFSIGAALLAILITGRGIIDLFALFLAIGNYFYLWVVAPFMGGGGGGA